MIFKVALSVDKSDGILSDFCAFLCNRFAAPSTGIPLMLIRVSYQAYC